MTAIKGHAGVARRNLDALAQRKGIQRRYTDGTGQRRHASHEAVMAVLRTMGEPIDTSEQATARLHAIEQEEARRLCAPVSVVWKTKIPTLALGPGCGGADPLKIDLLCEDGSQKTLIGTKGETAIPIDDDVPIGIHRLRVQCGSRQQEGIVLVARPRCHDPGDQTTTGAFLPLYALRSRHSLGIGNLGDLQQLGRWAADSGARYLGTLPLLTTFLDDPFEPSPYMPVSRSIFGELFIDLYDAADRYELKELQQLLASPDWQAEAGRLRDLRLVDYRGAWGLVRQGLERAADEIFRKPMLRERVESSVAKDPLIADYAAFRAQRAPERDAGEEERLFLTAQWLLNEQLARTARAGGAKSGLYLDLPIGSHPHGFDAWRQPDLYAHGVSLGAPPDGLFQGGQSWGFPPVIPDATRQSGHRAFITAIDRHLRYASALRIDHAAGLFRCFWVPDGMSAADGVYVHQPAEEYLALLSILSHKHQSTIIAENLGTVPKEITRGLARRGLLNMSILQFDLGGKDEPLPELDTRTLAALNTHDMPTFAAHWSGSDIDLHAKLGVVEPADAPRHKQEREAMRRRVVSALRERGLIDSDMADDEGSEPQPVLEALLRLAADAVPSILLVNLEDLWGEGEPQNVPGIAEGFPNWRRKAARTLEEITSDDRLSDLITELSGVHAV